MSGVVVVDHSIVTNNNASSLATPTTNLQSPTSAYTAHTTHALYSSSSASAKRASIVSLRLKKVSDHTNIPWQDTFPSRKFNKNSNNIRTTKYTLLTFIPVFLFSQVHILYIPSVKTDRHTSLGPYIHFIRFIVLSVLQLLLSPRSPDCILRLVLALTLLSCRPAYHCPCLLRS